jgi:hypothetical protein
MLQSILHGIFEVELGSLDQPCTTQYAMAREMEGSIAGSIVSYAMYSLRGRTTLWPFIGLLAGVLPSDCIRRPYLVNGLSPLTLLLRRLELPLYYGGDVRGYQAMQF